MFSSYSNFLSLQEISLEFDADMRSPAWKNAAVTNDIQTIQGCGLMSYGVLQSYWHCLGPLQLLGQVAPIVAQLIDENLERVILHFCNPNKGWYTLEPLISGKLLEKVLAFSVNGNLADVLRRVHEFLSKHRMGEIFIIGLEKDPPEVGHCAPCLCHQGGILFGCAHGIFRTVIRINVYVYPSNLKQILDVKGFKIPEATPLTLNGSVSCKCAPWMDICRSWCTDHQKGRLG